MSQKLVEWKWMCNNIQRGGQCKMHNEKVINIDCEHDQQDLMGMSWKMRKVHIERIKAQEGNKSELYYL